MAKKYSQTYRVPFYQSDANRQMTLPALLSVALQISGEHSMALGRSDSWIAEKYNLAWIVTEYAISVSRMPDFLEEIVIETEAVSYNKIFCYRDFEIFSADRNEKLLTIHSTWVMMDIDSRKVSRQIEEIVAPFDVEKVTKIERGHHFLSSLDAPVSQRYRVRFSDIDSNQHVNNSKYYDWAIDVLGFDFLVSHQPREIFIKYNHEVLPDTEVTSSMQQIGSISHHKINDGDCEIEIAWAERKGEK